MKNSLFEDLLKYLSVAIIALLADVGSLTFLIFAKLDYLIAATIAFLIGTIVNFVLGNGYVFKNPIIKNKVINFTAFISVGIVSLLLNDLIIWVAYTKAHAGIVIAKIVAIALTFFWNFMARRNFLYNRDTLLQT